MSTSVVRETVAFGSARKLARIEHSSKTFFCTVGFDNPSPLGSAIEIPIDSAFLTVILAELAPRPRATITEIQNIVEAIDQESEVRYTGHDPDLIASLFPLIRAFELPAVPPEATWKVFFTICIEECQYTDSWIENDLSQTLQSVCERDPDRIPYQVLCRSIFDGDPTSFFLALYRCLEALYAFSSAQRVVSSLDLQTPWTEMAAVLENELGWYPREESSLERLVGMADVDDLRALGLLLGNIDPKSVPELLPDRVARSIYRLRNSIVHFRPAQHVVDLQKIDWNAVCKQMAIIVTSIYSKIFPGS
jgi:hypothetical protein